MRTRKEGRRGGGGEEEGGEERMVSQICNK